MKSTWLYCALCAIVLCVVPYSYTWWTWIFIVPFLFRRQGVYCLISFALLFVLTLRMKPPQINQPEAHTRLKIHEIHTSYVIAEGPQGKFLLYGAESYGLDDVLEADIRCKLLNSQKNFGLFDFSAYMKKRNIHYSCELKESSLLAQGNSLRASLWKRVQAFENPQRKWLLQSLYHIQDKEDRLEFIGSTGLHLSLLLHCLTSLASLWISKRRAQGICLFVLAGAATLGSWRDSLLRIFCFRLVAWLMPHNKQDRLGISALLLLICRPYLVNELVFVLPFLFRFLALFQHRHIPRFFYTMSVLIPLQFYYFHELDIIGLLIFSVLRYLYMVNYCCAMLYCILPFSLLFPLGNLILEIIRSLESFHISFYYQASLLFVTLWLYFLLHCFHRRNRRAPFSLLLMLLYTQYAPYFRPYAHVLMLDVGQGDCTLISLPFHQGNILIDVAGSEKRNIPKDVIVPALQAQGVTSIDALIITHDDLDHSGGLEQLQELMEVKRIITSKQETLEFGSFQFLFLLPDAELSDKNENSIITYVDLFKQRFLFMGDAGKQAEALLMKRYPSLKADILKVGHHGSKSASSRPFLHSLHPLLALISCGAHNFYGHPHQEVLDALQTANISIMDTPHTGAVSIKITNFFQIYKTAAGDFGVIHIK